MLFNSYEFIFLFLPITFLGFYLIGRAGCKRLAISWLVGASLFFYSWWNPFYLILILGSILFNYTLGLVFASKTGSFRKWALAAGIAVNLGVLGYFKYANFLVDNVNRIAATDYTLNAIILPLAISFFTFQQIAYLVDSYRGRTKEYNFLHYCLFVTFFPQLIAGPIVHHAEMMPQFLRNTLHRLNAENLAVGLTIFIIGLFKKVVLADGVSTWANFFFNAADSGMTLSFAEAWVGALSYSLQLYFDFSGYSDMAIGLARMFGIRLPLNFNSPYKALSIIDFWKRWHITLSRFLRDYLYIPLGGNRKGSSRRYANIMITMLLGGLWHGAGWNFLIWGGLHGLYLVINHAWRYFFRGPTGDPGKILCWSITFLAVVVAWVPFRAGTLAGAKSMLASMAGFNDLSVFHGQIEPLGGFVSWLGNHGVVFDGVLRYLTLNSFWAWTWIAVLMAILLLFPNTQQFMRRYKPAFEVYPGEISGSNTDKLIWSPTIAYSLLSGLLVTVIIINYLVRNSSSMSEFLYFNF